jgi:hypothetical protein
MSMRTSYSNNSSTLLHNVVIEDSNGNYIREDIPLIWNQLFLPNPIIITIVLILVPVI